MVLGEWRSEVAPVFPVYTSPQDLRAGKGYPVRQLRWLQVFWCKLMHRFEHFCSSASRSKKKDLV